MTLALGLAGCPALLSDDFNVRAGSDASGSADDAGADASTSEASAEAADAGIGVGGDIDVTSDAARNIGDSQSSESGNLDETDGTTEDGAVAGNEAGSLAPCCAGRPVGQNFECCQFSQSFCNDSGTTWLNTGTGCSPSTIGGAITAPSCLGTIVVCN